VVVKLWIEIAAAAVLVLVVSVVVIAGRRRRHRRSSWLDELASVRGEGDGLLTGGGELAEGSPFGSGDVASLADLGAPTLVELAGREVIGPDGLVFYEYGGESAPLTRVSGDEHAASSDGSTLTVEISRGSVWRLGEMASWHPDAETPLLVRTAAGDISTEHADLLVTAEADGWTYVLCFGGSARVVSDDRTVAIQADQVARLHAANPAIQVVTTAAGSLEGDGLVRLHRRLDRGAVSLEPSGSASSRQ
jgi:hypothetical protein